ncbi:hypothetical protein [Halobacillus ihumii]|uniref:hypothetical protein n=1 Tax=Halobacillus ihumii TaxID=2686092 RepID=UPI0013D837E8|nr:hypothetical protein [Halobacillus ihumii]
MTDEKQMETKLWDILEEEGMVSLSFEEAQVCTYNNGLVVSLEDGSEFQLTVVRSK